MNRISLALLVLLMLSSVSAFADAPCAPGIEVWKDGKCVPIQTPTQNQTAGEFGQAAPQSQSSGNSSESLHKQEGNYDAETDLEKKRYEYLLSKYKANQMQNQLDQQTQGGPEVGGNGIPIYLTMVQGPSNDLVGTVIYRGDVWTVKAGSVIGNGIIVSRLYPSYAVISIGGRTHYVGLSTIGAVQQGEQGQQTGGQGGVPNPAVPITTGPTPVQASSLPPQGASDLPAPNGSGND